MQPSPSLEGRRFGRYILRQKIADGGMASVYLAQLEEKHGLAKYFAIKITHPHLAHQQRFVSMFMDEARLTARIQHPNVCALYDYGEQDGVPYIVLEYLHGESLRDVYRSARDKGGLPAWIAAKAVADAARGLHAAHELVGDDGHPLGIVHRDISPQNIFVLYDGVSKVVDFGVAKARGRITESQTGELKGKFAYMAPEQLRGGNVDRRADIWALGVVLWQFTTGKSLFNAEDAGSTLVNVMQSAIVRPSELVDNYPPLLERAILGALERNPEKRTQTAAGLADHLDDYLYSIGKPTGPAQVAEWMNQYRHLRAMPGGPSAVPLGVDSVSGLERLDASEVRSRPPDREGITSPFAQVLIGRQQRSRRMLFTVTATALAVATLGLGALLFLDDEPPQVAVVAAPAPVVTPASPVDPPVAPAGTMGPAPAPPPAQVVAPPPAPPEERTAETAPRPSSSPARPLKQGGTKADRPPGSLSLLVIPAADVYWRGGLLGRSPIMNKQLPSGVQRLELRPLNGGPSKRLTVTIEPGKATRQSFRL